MLWPSINMADFSVDKRDISVYQTPNNRENRNDPEHRTERADAARANYSCVERPGRTLQPLGEFIPYGAGAIYKRV